VKLDTEFIRLPYRFDVERLAKEVAQLPESSWIDHPSDYQGNLAVPLISLHGEDNNDFNGEMKTTPHLDKCEYLQQVIASFGEVIGRSRLMRLEGNCDVKEHADGHYHWYSRVRIHVPIITYPEVTFYCGDEHVHMGAGECWIFNSWLKHRVVNPTPHTRIHLVIDTTGSSAFWDTVAHSQWPFKPHNNVVKETSFIPYQPGKKVEILTEKYNVIPVMAPGEVEALIEDLVIDYTQNKKNKAEHMACYTNVLRAFCKDWRRLWLLHGFNEAGIPHYDVLTRNTMKSLQKIGSPIFLNSNRYDVIQLFMSRVLSVAICRNVRASVLGQFQASGASEAVPQKQKTIHPAQKTANIPLMKNALSDKTGRNDPCHCGSGKKFKHCHGSLALG
jgi:hypothetical protein